MKTWQIIGYITILFANIFLIVSYEDKQSLRKRLNFYKLTSIFSNNTVVVGTSPTKGLSCMANKAIEYGRKVMEIPKKYSLCPYYMFPFKFEFVKILKEIPMLTQSVGKEQTFSIYLLTYFVLYYTKAQKEDIRRYIFDKKLVHYYNCTEVDELLKDSFPKIMLNSATFEDEHYEVLKNLGYNVKKGEELRDIHKYVLSQVYKSDHVEMIFPWISNFEEFKWAYSIVMSRGMSLRFNEYFILENLKTKQNSLTKSEKMNVEINKYFSANSGAPCVIAFIDLCNHYHPKYEDMRDKRTIFLDSKPGYFLNTIGSNALEGEEISYTYTNDPSNLIMLLHYGFVIPHNIFNLARLSIEDNKQLTLEQFNLCKELGCIDSSASYSLTGPFHRITTINIRKINNDLINYGRVKQLTYNFDQKSVLKAYANEIPYTYQNEVMGWLFYYQICYKTLASTNGTINKSIANAQKYRNYYKKIETNWKDEESQRAEWSKQKTYENIYLMDISFKMIVVNHLKLSYNKIILHTQNELNKIKNSFLS